MIFFELLGLRLSPGLRIHGCCFRDPCEAPVDKFQFWWWSFWKWLLRFFLETNRKLRCLGGANTPEYIVLPQNVLMNPFFAWANEITIMTHTSFSTWLLHDPWEIFPHDLRHMTDNVKADMWQKKRVRPVVVPQRSWQWETWESGISQMSTQKISSQVSLRMKSNSAAFLENCYTQTWRDMDRVRSGMWI